MIFVFLLAVLLIPLTMLWFGRHNYNLAKLPAIKGEPGLEAGYATKQSTKSHRTWVLANKVTGLTWLIGGAVSAAASAIALLLYMGQDIKVLGWVLIWITAGQLVVLASPVLPLELILRLKYDKLGLPKNKGKKKKKRR